MRTLVTALVGAALIVILASSSVLAGGPPGLAFYVDGQLYRTVGTPTDLSGTGAPDATFDVIYDLGGNGVRNVAEAAPGDSDYNGGRWMVLLVSWNVPAVQLYSAAQVQWAATQGWLSIAATPAREFVCPVIPVQGGGA